MSVETFHDGRVVLHGGDCLDVLAGFEAGAVDAVVTDPPYELGFMARAWDRSGIAFRPETWAAIGRVMKPGAHLVAFGAPKNFHRMVCAIEDAGFEVRDCIFWVFGSGFPKSMDVGKAVAKEIEKTYGLAKCGCLDAGNGRPIGCDSGCFNREDVRFQRSPGGQAAQDIGHPNLSFKAEAEANSVCELREDDREANARPQEVEEIVLFGDVRSGGSEDARLGSITLWAGLEGDATDSAGERQGLSHMRVDAGAERPGAARPPHQAFSHGRDERSGESDFSLRGVSPQDRSGNNTAVAVDPDRREDRRVVCGRHGNGQTTVEFVCSWCGLPDGPAIDDLRAFGSALKPAYEPICLARWPLSEKTVAANVLRHGTGALNIDAARIGFDGGTRTVSGCRESRTVHAYGNGLGARGGIIETVDGLGRWPANICHDGSDEVVEAFPTTGPSSGNIRNNSARGKSAAKGAEKAHVTRGVDDDGGSAARFFYSAKADADDRLGSKHPTVKPVDLMQWLVRMICPKGGLVLDPFAGTGTTGEAALREGMRAALIERETEHIADIARRMRHVFDGETGRKVARAKAKSAGEDHGPLFAPQDDGAAA